MFAFPPLLIQSSFNDQLGAFSLDFLNLVSPHKLYDELSPSVRCDTSKADQLFRKKVNFPKDDLKAKMKIKNIKMLRKERNRVFVSLARDYSFIHSSF